MSSFTRHSHRRWPALAASGAVLLSLSGLPGAAAAQSADEQPPEERSCPVVAAATGVHLMGRASDNILLEKPGGVSLPAAQSCVAYGLRDSWSFAGAPHPGENLTALPASLRGSGLPVPDYPAHVASRYPASPKAEKSENGYTLRARSGETSSESTAHSGVDEEAASIAAATVSARSEVDPVEGTSRAHAESDTRPITIADVLVLGRIRSTATASMSADGAVTRDASLRVGTTSVAGERVEITPDGVVAAGQTVGTPTPDPAEALEEAGISVRYLTPLKTERGVVAAGIEVLVRHRDAESGAVYEAHYTLGRALAAVSEVPADPGSGGDVAAGTSTGTESATSGAGTASEQPVAGDAASGPATAADVSGAPGAPQAAEAPHVAPPPDVRAAPAPARLSGTPVGMGIAGLYLVIVFGALAMVAGGTLLRLLGVKTRWTA